MEDLQQAPVQNFAQRLTTMLVMSLFTAGGTVAVTYALQYFRGGADIATVQQNAVDIIDTPPLGQRIMASIASFDFSGVSSIGRAWQLVLLFMVMEVVREAARTRDEGFSLMRVLSFANFKEAAGELLRGRLPAMPAAEPEPPARKKQTAMDLRAAEDTERANERMRLRQQARAAAKKEE